MQMSLVLVHYVLLEVQLFKDIIIAPMELVHHA